MAGTKVNVSTDLITDSAVTTPKINNLAVTTAKIADSNVTNGKMATNSVSTSNIIDSNVTTAKIADLNVTTAKIADSNVTTTKIANLNVTTGKLANGAVDNTKLAANAVETVHITDANVTKAKLSAVNQSVSSGGSVTLNHPTGETDVVSTTITTSGRPVIVFVASDATSTGSLSSRSTNTGVTPSTRSRFVIKRDSTPIHFADLANNTGDSIEVQPNMIQIDNPGVAALYTYKLTAQPIDANTETKATKVQIAVIEL